MKRDKAAMIGLVITLSIFIIAIIAPFITPYNPIEGKLSESILQPSREHLLGTDKQGRDIFSRLLYGARISLLTGLLATGISFSIGVTLGIIAGYFRKLDEIIMRIMDVILAFPYFLLAILVVSVLGPGLLNTILAVSIGGIARFCRLTRGATVSVKEELYVQAAKSVGATDIYIIFYHILPNIIGPLLALAALNTGRSILGTASLSFLGLGAKPPTPEWGLMIYSARSYWMIFPNMIIFPGVAVTMTVLGFSLLGDALRDILDPRYRYARARQRADPLSYETK